MPRLRRRTLSRRVDLTQRGRWRRKVRCPSRASSALWPTSASHSESYASQRSGPYAVSGTYALEDVKANGVTREFDSHGRGSGDSWCGIWLSESIEGG